MKKYLFAIIVFSIYYFMLNYACKISAESLLDFNVIYNIAASNKYVVYEHEENVNNSVLHYLSIINTETKEISKILSNDGEYINSSMFFPSISDDGNFVVFTSRATNITNDTISKCVDISDGVKKNCNNIYLYNISSKTSMLIKYENEMFNGDNYVAKISGNGNAIVFESISTNVVYNQFDCSNLNGTSSCINIYKYNILTNKVSLVSTGKNNYGGNSNSISPSISGDGRYITYQSSATNILPDIKYPKYCNNFISNDSEVCSNIFLVDTINLSTKIISMYENQVFNNSSGNSIISDNGKYVAYESYSTDIATNGKSHIYLYNVEKEVNFIITKKDKNFYNRDSYLDDISSDGKYIIYRTGSTNIGEFSNQINLYVYSIDNSQFSVIDKEVQFSTIDGNNVIYYNDDKSMLINKIDSLSPVIYDDQIIYVLMDNMLNIKDKILVDDNLTSREKIDIYLDNIELFENVGEYEIFVTVVDEFDNISSNNVKVVVLRDDIEAPVFNEITEIKILKGSSTLNLSNYIQAIDKVDGSTRVYIIDDGDLNLDVSGTYKVRLMSKDNKENVSYKEIDIIVYDNYDFSYFYEIILIIGVIVVIIFSIIKVK